MCLTKIEEEYNPPSTLIIDGWKQFTQASKKLEFQNFGVKPVSREVPLDTWIIATSTSIPASDGANYMTGFHVYTEEPQNKKSYTRVFVRKVTYRGLQGSEKCLIAQEMYVPSTPNGWPPTTSEERQKQKSLVDKIKSKLPGGNA